MESHRSHAADRRGHGDLRLAGCGQGDKAHLGTAKAVRGGRGRGGEGCRTADTEVHGNPAGRLPVVQVDLHHQRIGEGLAGRHALDGGVAADLLKVCRHIHLHGGLRERCRHQAGAGDRRRNGDVPVGGTR